MSDKNQRSINNDTSNIDISLESAWGELKKFTQARIGQGRVGCSLPSQHVNQQYSTAQQS